MRIRSVLSLPVALIIGASCSSSAGSAPTPAPAPTPARAQAGAGGRAGAPQLTPEQRAARRDSLGALRAATVKELMATIAGHENEPAEKVFKNIQLMKTVPASQLLTVMDQGIGRALSANCDGCHVVGKWDSDSLARKGRARIMLGMVNVINTEQLPKLGPRPDGRPRTVQCVTCHRGGNPASTALIP